jgi:ElaB/YqjD/DUF883 family membrane-anchored ribosome-binding protein
METDTEAAVEQTGAGARGNVEGVAAKCAEIESRLFQGYDDLVAGAKEIGDVTSHHVRLHPLVACGFAFLAGVTLARLLRR